MKQLEEIEALRDIPGYKTALKAVLKSQIQYLAEQLSQETEEETVILSASTADGTLSRLGSLHGKDFLQDKDDIQFQFLQHCLQKKGLAPCISEGRTALMDSTQTFEDDASVSPPLLLRKTSESMLGESHTSITDVTGKETNKLLITIAKTGQSKHSVRLKRKKETSGLSKRLKKSSSKSQEDTVVDKSFEETDIFAIADASTTQLRSNTDTGNTTSDTEIKVESLIKETSDIVGDSDMAVDSSAEVKSEPKSDNEDDFAAEAPSSDDEQLEPLSKEETIQEAEEGQPSKAISGTPIFTCLRCDKDFETQSALKRHTKRHGEKFFKCQECTKSFHRKDELNHHVYTHTQDLYHMCDICGICFKTKASLYNHKTILHLKKLFDCAICQKSFVTKQNKIRHEKNHGSKEECEVCKNTFKTVKEHKKLCGKSNRKRTHACDICGKCFLERKYLQEHKRYKHGAERYQCRKCLHPFAYRKSLIDHRKKCTK